MNPRKLISDLFEDFPDAKEEYLFNVFCEQIDKEAKLIALRYYFNSVVGRMSMEKSKDIPRKNIEAVKNKLRKVVLMNIMLPCGKKLKDATFAECGQAGDWLKMIEGAGLPNELVSSKFTEKDLWSLVDLNYVRNVRKLKVA